MTHSASAIKTAGGHNPRVHHGSVIAWFDRCWHAHKVNRTEASSIVGRTVGLTETVATVTQAEKTYGSDGRERLYRNRALFADWGEMAARGMGTRPFYHDRL